MKKKLAIVSTHPIQYNAPVFRMLTERSNIIVKVFYTWGESVLKDKYDPGFSKVIEWDIPLLDGYDYLMVENSSKDPGSHHYKGIVNPDLNKEIERWGANAILIYGWSFSGHFSAMKYFHGKIPVLFRGDSNLLDQGSNLLKDFVRKLFLKYIYRHADYFLYAGSANRDYYLNAGIKESNLFFAPHAVDNSRFGIRTERAVRKQLSVSENEVLFLYAGKFEEKKNVSLLIEAFSALNNTSSHLLLTGEGPCDGSLRIQVEKTAPSIRNRIHFMGFQNQSAMPDLYQSCDIFVLPSKGPGETWGLAINEAMASSKAVIASNKCGAAMDLVQNGVNGFVFESNNVISLTEKMNLLANDMEKIMTYGNHSMRIISEWSFENLCKMVENVVLQKTDV